MEMSEPNDDVCPHCGTNLQGDPIPQKIIDAYSGTHSSKRIGVEIRGVYDGVLYWQCPFCAGRWHRFTPGNDRRYDAAVQYVEGNR